MREVNQLAGTFKGLLPMVSASQLTRNYDDKDLRNKMFLGLAGSGVEAFVKALEAGRKGRFRVEEKVVKYELASGSCSRT